MFQTANSIYCTLQWKGFRNLRMVSTGATNFNCYFRKLLEKTKLTLKNNEKRLIFSFKKKEILGTLDISK